MKFFKLIAAIAAGVFLSLGPVFSNAVSSNAPDRDELYDEIVVSAVGFETPKSHIGSAISVITAEDIELLQADFVTDALSHLSGVSFDQDGGMGGVGYLRMRGFDRAYVAVVVDGIALGDPSDPQGASELANLQTSGIDRIELLRGAQSILYGSNAVAGAIQLFTQKGEGPLSGKVAIETGSLNTQRIGASSQFGSQKFAMRLSLDHIESQPKSELDKHNTQYSEDEDYENSAFSGRFDFMLGDNTDLMVISRGGQASAEYDGYDPVTYAPVDGWFGMDTDEWAVNAALTHKILENRVIFKLHGGRFERRRDSFQEIGTGYWNDGGRDNFGFQSTVRANDAVTLNIGFEQKDERFAQGGLSEKSTDTRSYYGLAQVAVTPELHASVAWRNDTHSLFGSHDSWRHAIAYQITDRVKLYASQGVGFRAPSLYELYGEDPVSCVNGVCGNANLSPETSRSSDIGAEFSLLNRRLMMNVNAFRIRLKDRIIFKDIGPPTYLGNYQNDLGRAQSDGLEVSADYNVNSSFMVSTNMTFIDPRKADGTIANKQPRQILNLSGRYMFGQGRGLVSASWRHVSQRYVSSVRQEDYGLLSLRSEWKWSDGYVFYGRVENALNDHYQTSAGKSTPGRQVTVGIRVDL